MITRIIKKPQKFFNNIRGQRYIPVQRPSHIEPNAIGPRIAGSEQFLEEAECKVNLAKAHGDYNNREEEYP
jgi:hypothetical protein